MISKFSLEGQLSLSKQIGEELHWWIQNFSFVNWEVLNFSPIATDNKFKGINLRLGRVSCQGQITGRPRFQEKTKSHINALELKASKLAIMIYMDSMVALSYLVKMGSKKETGISHHHQTKLRLPLAPQDRHYCRVPTKGIEWRSR